jgi:hypothetical protein
MTTKSWAAARIRRITSHRTNYKVTLALTGRSPPQSRKTRIHRSAFSFGKYAGLDTWAGSLLFWLGQAGVPLLLVGVLITPIFNWDEPIPFSVVSTTERSYILPSSPIPISEISKRVERQMLHILSTLNRQSHLNRIMSSLGIRQSRSLDKTLRRFDLGTHQDRMVSGVNRKSAEFVQGRQRRTLTMYVAITSDWPQRNITLNDCGAYAAPICKYARYINWNKTRYAGSSVRFKDLFGFYKSEMANYNAWPMIGNVCPVKKPRLKDQYNNQHEIEQHKSLVVPVSRNGDRTTNADGFGFLFVAGCYVSAILLGIFSCHWHGVALGGISLSVATVTMLFEVFPWDWSPLAVVPITGVVIVISCLWGWRVWRCAE